MVRTLFPVCLVVGLLLACGGGSSPTAPDAVPDSLAGTWRGEMSGSVGGAAFDCALEVDLRDQGDGIFFGEWEAACPGETVVGPAAAFTFADLTILQGIPLPTETTAHPLASCGWAASVTLRGSELSGTWQVPEGCQDATLAGGPLRLRFAG